LEYAEAKITKPNGEVVIIEKDQMKEEKNFEEYGRFYFFALEGLEIGSVIEFDYTIIKYPDYNGDREIAQEDVPIYNYKFSLLCPPHLIFTFNPIGIAGMPVKDTLDTLRNIWVNELAYIPAYKEEPYSNIRPSLCAYYYKLNENIAANRKDITSYSWATQSVYAKIHVELEKNDIKAMNKISKSLGLTKMDEEEKIKTLEKYIKTNVYQVDNGEREKLRNITTMLETGNTDEVGITILFANWLKELDIKYQLILTCDRFSQNFDKDFESFSFLSQYLIYFPNTGEYLAPSERLFRYGLIPYELTENYGMYILPIELGGNTTAVPKVKWIPASESYLSVDSTVYEIDLSDMENPSIKTYKSLTGYESVFIHGNMVHFSEEQLEEIKESLIRNIRDDEEIISVDTENSEEEFVGVKPLVFKGEILYPNLLGVAGENYLIHIGTIIGLQMELYQEHNRVNDISMEFNHTYDRTIKLKIPEGYELKNLEELEMNVTFDIDGKEKMAFVSSYEVKDDILIVHNVEYYNALKLPKEDFEGFKKVINAAADFNKIVVVLTKK